MPETRFRIRWPDGAEDTCYSPSTVIGVYLSAGETYALSDFVARSRAALARASDRVAARYGRPCSLAAAEQVRIAARAAGFAPDATVACLSIGP